MNRSRGQSPQRPTGRICVCDDGERVPKNYDACVLGRHIRPDPKKLGAFLLQEIPARAEDLLVLAGAVAFADRRVPRHHSTCWERNLVLCVPVRDIVFWEQTKLRIEMQTLLGILTGDRWCLQFRGGRKKLPVNAQESLLLPASPPTVIPFSNGLDSFAVARLHNRPGQQIIRVTTGRVGDSESKTSAVEGTAGLWVAMPISLPNDGLSLREQSYRSRGFLFGTVAATAAGLMHSNEIIVPESGQSTFGPALTLTGHEHPDVRTSPVFTRALGCFVSKVFERQIKFIHPRIWSTKGETLEALRINGLSNGWEKTVSCSRGSRRRPGGVRAVHCGICANCLLRRQSVLAAKLHCSAESYIWPKLSGAPPWRACADDPEPGKSEIQQAISAALAMRDLAFIDPSTEAVTQEAAAIADALGQDEYAAQRGLRHVLQKHREEWLALLETLQPNSLTRQLGGLP